MIPTWLEALIALYLAGVLLFTLEIPQEKTSAPMYIFVVFIACLWPAIVLFDFIDWIRYR
jgi:hypothetical protein